MNGRFTTKPVPAKPVVMKQLLSLVENSTLSILDGLLVNLEKKSLVSALDFHDCDIVIPRCIRSLGRHSVYRKGHIRRVSFQYGSKLETIDNDAFKYCEIDELYLPYRLSSIGRDIISHVRKMIIEDGNSALTKIDANYLASFMKGGLIKLSNSVEINDMNYIPDYVHLISHSWFPGAPNHGFILLFSSSELCEVQELEDVEQDFVNPRMEGYVLLMGALRLCDNGVIGRGGQGTVKVKENIVTGEVIAVKTMHFGSQITNERWETLKAREYQLQAMRHCCLVGLKGYCFDDASHRMRVGMAYVCGPVMEPSCSETDGKMPNGLRRSVNLKEVLEIKPSWWTIATKIVAIIGIAAGLDYMHDLGMCHRDLKPSNILFDSEFHPKICDFDVARSDDMSDDSSSMTVNVGTILYMAPEVVSGDYNHKADYYSFGLILYEIFEGSEALQRQMMLDSCKDWTFTDCTPSELQNIIESCLSENPDYRCGFLDDDPSLFGALQKTFIENMGLSDVDREFVEHYAEETQRLLDDVVT